MSYANQLATEINTHMDRLAEAGMQWRPTWIANSICADHLEGLADSEYARFWQHCAHVMVRNQVIRAMNKRTSPIAGDEAPRLPGFEHLQLYYSVKRDHEEIGVHIFDLTDAEIEEKARFLDAMGETCSAHAGELRRFKHLRRGQHKGRGQTAA